MILVFADNDVLIKLAHWSLLDALVSAFGASWSEVATLSSLRFRALKEDPKLFASPAVAQALAARLMQCQELPAPDPDVLQLIQDVPGIDAGEVALFAACAACPETEMVTGDKRALKALAEPTLMAVADRLKGRVVCLEQCLEAIVGHMGLDFVIQAIVPHRTIDSAIRCLVGAQGTSPDSFHEGLASYIADLRRQAGNLLR